MYEKKIPDPPLPDIRPQARKHREIGAQIFNVGHS